MLSHLHISNFTLVEKLDIEFDAGLTVLTGETGAGKSILLDALSLVMGDRADADKVRQNAERADIQAHFILDTLPFVSKWLSEHELNNDGDCLVRRVVTSEGRSRAFINGQAVTLQQLKALGDMLVDIHGQHEHQSLLKNTTHLRLLDEFGQQRALAKEVKRAFFHWHTTQQHLNEVQSRSDEVNARFQLLSYQVDELNQLAITPDELLALEQEQKQLLNLEKTQQHCQQVIDLCADDDHGVVNALRAAQRLMDEIRDSVPSADGVATLLEQALINTQEALGDVERELHNEAMQPERLPEIEARLSAIYDISRKHRVSPAELHLTHNTLEAELKQLQGGDALIADIEKTLSKHRETYTKLADKLSKARRSSAKKLMAKVNDKLSQLAMANAQFVIELADTNQSEPSANGNELVQFLISTSPGQAPKPLAKIASGGELSRISLAIQVATAQTSTIPTLVFDEVDVGIGGTTGDIVGKLLRELGEQGGQVLCVTHLAQVASKAHQHLRVEKHFTKDTVNSSLQKLDNEEKVLEVARMMGGAIDSEQSLAHAREMLSL